MNSRLVMALSLLFSLFSCASMPKDSVLRSELTAQDAIELSEDAAPKMAPGTFSFLIRAVGAQRQYVYLNTELDYRDRRNVSVVLLPEFQEAFLTKYGASAEVTLLNKRVTVSSFAKRMPIFFYEDGKQTDKYYYQTHIPVKQLDQITFCLECT
jgi:hypothetical protein